MFTTEDLTLPSYVESNRYERYFPIEATGQVLLSGYVQRPAAERNTKRVGLGLWDNRGKHIIAQPDPIERIDRLNASADFHMKQATEMREVVAAIRKANDIQ